MKGFSQALILGGTLLLGIAAASGQIRQFRPIRPASPAAPAAKTVEQNLIPNADFLANPPLLGWRTDFGFEGWYKNNKDYVRIVTDHAPRPGVRVVEINQPPGVASNQGTKLQSPFFKCEPGATYRGSVDVMTWHPVAFAKVFVMVYTTNPEPELHMLTTTQIPAMNGLPALKQCYRVQFPNPKGGKTWATTSREFTVPEKVSVKRATALLVEGDLRDVEGLAVKLKDASHPVSKFLFEQLSADTKKQMATEPFPDSLGGLLMADLNKILKSGNIYTPERFGQVRLQGDMTAAQERYASFKVEDIQNVEGMAARFQKGADPLSKFLMERFSTTTRRQVHNFGSNVKRHSTLSPSEALQKALVKEFNELVLGDCLYTPELFAQVRLSDATQAALKQNLRGPELVKLNRTLLEEAYPAELAKATAAAAGPPAGDTVRTNRLLLEDTYPEIEKLKRRPDVTQRPEYMTFQPEMFGTALQEKSNIVSYFCNFRIVKVKAGE
ncbi:MAG: hypothetical protein WCV00_06865 [Verrucomicrobiia bacterium]|jgi:hypothetical protein